MQRCDCTVRLAGELGNTVRKTGVSPAEIVVLRFIHGGDDTVVEIQPTNMDKSSHANERERLKYIYGAEVVEKLFPGAYAKLPISLRDVTPTMEEAHGEEEEEGQQEEEVVPANGTAERMTDSGPKAGADDELTEDDKALITMIQDAHNIGELRAIATANEVEVTSLPKDVPGAKVHMIRSLFPMHQQ